MSEYIFEIETAQTCPIRSLFEALKDIVNDTNIIFTPEGIKIVTLDGTNIVVVHLFLDAKEFEMYRCNTDKFNVGVNMDNLHRLVRSVTAYDSLRFYVEKQNPDILGIRIVSSTQKEVTDIEYRTLAVELEEYVVDDIDPVCTLTMPSTKLLNICRNMNVIGDTLEFICRDDEFMITCHGDSATVRKMLQEDRGNVHLISDKNKPVNYRYDIKFITMFTKATSLSNKVVIQIQEDGALVITYSVAKLGELKFVLSAMFTDL